jgi:Ca-activated chloride channel family protein
MTFAHPYFLWLLLVIPPALLLFFWWSERVRRKLMSQFIQARLLPGLVSGVSPARQKIRGALLVGAAICLLLTLARPQWGYDLDEVQQRGLDIVVAIDTSKSMLAQDISPNRLARAKLAALDLMQQAKSDRLGLVAFAGTAYLQCPLTIDDTVFRQSVEALNVNTLPVGGTALAEAIDTALKAFKEGDNYKVLVLFTDGEDHDSDAVDAARRAAEEGMRIFTIGIGTPEGELLPAPPGPNGQLDHLRDENGNVVQSRLNAALLDEIARTANGFYLPLRAANTIDTLYQKGLAPLPRSETKEKWVRRARERYHWPLAVAIVLLIVEILFPERRSPTRRDQKKEMKPFGSVPEEVGEQKRAGSEIGAPVAAAVMFLLLISSGTSMASPSSALRAYRSGRFDEAQKEYERLAAEDKKGDARLIFNAGTAAYRATNYDAAVKFFTTTLTTARDAKLQQAAWFNLGNTQFRTGQTAKDLDGIQQTWETAIKSYQNAVTLDKADADAANNLAYARNCVAQIIQLREAARQAKFAADEATRRRNYHAALQIMESLLKQNPLGKQFEDFTKRLQDIDAIATPHQP